MVINGVVVVEHVVVVVVITGVVVVNGGVVVLIVINGRACRSVGGKMGCDDCPWASFFISFATLAALISLVA